MALVSPLKWLKLWDLRPRPPLLLETITILKLNETYSTYQTKTLVNCCHIDNFIKSRGDLVATCAQWLFLLSGASAASISTDFRGQFHKYLTLMGFTLGLQLFPAIWATLISGKIRLKSKYFAALFALIILLRSTDFCVTIKMVLPPERLVTNATSKHYFTDAGLLMSDEGRLVCILLPTFSASMLHFLITGLSTLVISHFNLKQKTSSVLSQASVNDFKGTTCPRLTFDTKVTKIQKLTH